MHNDMSDTNKVYSKKELYKLINYFTYQTDNYAVGAHFYGDLKVDDRIKLFETKTGKMPAFVDFDMNNLAFLNNSDIKTVIPSLLDFVSKGGFVTITDHWITPTNNYSEIKSGQGANHSRGVLTKEQYYQVMTPGTRLNINFLSELKSKAEFLRLLKESNIPVIFRPLHEANGAWFWWSMNNENNITGCDVAKLYKFVYNYFTVINGLDNIIWEFCTATAGYRTNYCDWYPGDDFVDILATDWYPGLNEIENSDEGFYDNFYKQTIKICGKKPYALSEYGGDGTYDTSKYPLKQTLSALETRIDSGSKTAYVGLYFDMPDGNDWSLPKRAVTLDRIKQYWEQSKLL